MALSVHATGQNAQGTGASIAVTASAAANEGDLILIGVCLNMVNVGAKATAAISGFTSLGSIDVGSDGWNKLELFAKTAGAAEGTQYTCMFSGGSGALDSSTIGLITITGENPTAGTPVTLYDTSSNTTYSIPALTTQNATAFDIAIVGAGGNNALSGTSFLSNWGSLLLEDVDICTNAKWSGVGIAHALRAIAGLQAATSVTGSVGDESLAIRLEVFEAAAAGGFQAAWARGSNVVMQ